MTDASLSRLERESAELVRRLRRWTQASWATPAGGGPAGALMSAPGRPAAPSRAELAHGCVQRLADLAAVAEARASRCVPRARSDLVLADQLAVMVEDIGRIGEPGPTAAALAALVDLRAALTG